MVTIIKMQNKVKVLDEVRRDNYNTLHRLTETPDSHGKGVEIVQTHNLHRMLL